MKRISSFNVSLFIQKIRKSRYNYNVKRKRYISFYEISLLLNESFTTDVFI